MKKKDKRNNNEELNFWQPASDMFSALLLILMLIILLLGLYLVHIPENTLKDPDAGNTFADSDHDKEDEATETPIATQMFWLFDGGGGDGGGMFASAEVEPIYTATVTVSPSPTITPTPDLPGGGAAGGGGGEGGGEGAGEGPGDEPDAGLKSAVYVMLVDAETNRSIKEANVEFELYGDNHALQVLNVYYPERISFRFFETTEYGTFYFPEKLALGSYELHELTEPEGYDAAANVSFDLYETYDWSDPLVVEVQIYPSRNILRIQMKDAETGRPLAGSVFDIIAAENIITADGTLRYRNGQVVGEIECDENGEGASEELYLGPYLIRQRVIPDYYVGLAEDIETEVLKKSGVLPSAFVVSSERSKIRISLKDELYPTRGIGGAVFSVKASGGYAETMEVTTNSSGEILLDSLEKGTAYQITQLTSDTNYRLDSNTYSILVSADGRIEGETEKTLELFNHMVRVSIGITDEFSDIQVSDVNLALYDAAGTLIRTWTTSGAPMVFNDLEPGSYYIVKDGDLATRYNIQIHDSVDLQTINVQTSYLMRYLIIGGIALFVLIVLAVVVIILLVRRRKRRNREE